MPLVRSLTGSLFLATLIAPAASRAEVPSLALRAFSGAVTPITAPITSLMAPKRDRLVPRTLNLRNTTWPRVRVELRLGPSANCDDNTQSYVRTLNRGERWSVTTSLQICWRREKNPGSTGAEWTPWLRRSVNPGQIIDANL